MNYLRPSNGLPRLFRRRMTCRRGWMVHYSGTLNESYFPRSFPWKDPWIRKNGEQKPFSLESSPDFSLD